MGKIAFVFAGQGAQYSGMGKDVAEYSKAAADIFKQADEVRPETSRQCFEGTEAELQETKNTQPCIYTVDMAIAAALEEKGIKADYAAGFSLGELAALAYAKAFDFQSGLELVSKRGALMQIASEKHDTGMAAVLKLSDEKIEELAAKYDNVYPVNFNCDGNVTVAADKQQLDAFAADVKAERGLARILKVSGAFHSPYMAEAAEGFGKVLADAEVAEVEIPVYSNRTAQAYEGDYKALLEEQIINPVRWKTLILNLIEEGVDTFIELGPGKALTSMITRISKDVTALNVSDVESLEKTVERMSEC
jgi:[acyl-carrier-protein] S-malonyltransferase